MHALEKCGHFVVVVWAFVVNKALTSKQQASELSQEWACPKNGHVPRMGLSQGYVQRVGLSQEWACPSPARSRPTITTFTTFNLSLFNLGGLLFRFLNQYALEGTNSALLNKGW